jgi:hypothetical protein
MGDGFGGARIGGGLGGHFGGAGGAFGRGFAGQRFDGGARSLRPRQRFRSPFAFWAQLL